jgi:hypothetical protein
MDVMNANPEAGSERDPVSLIQGLLETEDAPPRPTRNQKPEPEPEPEEGQPEPGPEVPPEEEEEEDGEDQPEQQQEPEEPELFTVKIDGKEAKVTREELLNGYQRQADYTRKTMEAAAQRQAAEQDAQRIHQERQHYSQQLEQVALVLQANLPAPPDERMLQTDPLTYVQQEKLYDNRVRQLQAILAEKQQADKQTAWEMERQHQQMLTSARDRLLSDLPEWKDPEKARTGQRELADYMRTIGYSEQEIAAASDPRAVVGFRKAMLYDRLQASQPKVNQKLATAPRMVKPGSAGPAPDQAKALTQRVKRSGGRDMDAIARLIELG